MNDEIRSGILYLSDEDIRHLEPKLLEDVTAAMREAFMLHGNGDTRQAPKYALDLRDASSEHEVRLNMYTGFLGGSHRVAVLKCLAAREVRLPGETFITGLAQLFDGDTGRPLAVMEAARLTAVRTAGATALAAQLLAAPGADHLAIVGTGVQAYYHGRILAEALPGLRVASIWSPDAARCERLATRLAQETRLEVRAASSLAETTEAHVLVTARSSRTPVLDAEHLKPGVLVAHVGRSDCALDAVPRFDCIVADNADVALARSHSLLARAAQNSFPEELTILSLADVVAGRAEGRRSATDAVLFSSVGLAIQDAACMRLAYTLAQSRGAGSLLPTSEHRALA